MFSISLFSKVCLIITTLFKIISTSVSTKYMLYQMVKLNEDYESYLSRDMESFEKKMNIDDFYYTIHNFEHRRIPAPFQKYDYDEYVRDSKIYCERIFVNSENFSTPAPFKKYEYREHVRELTNNSDSNYVKLDYYKRNFRFQLFHSAMKELNECLCGINNYITHRIDIVEAFEWDPDDDQVPTNEFIGKFMKPVRTFKTCISYAYIYNDEEVEDFKLEDCFKYKLIENSTSIKYASRLLQRLAKTKASHISEELLSCTRKFRKTFTNIMTEKYEKSEKKGYFSSKTTEKDDITLKELLMAHSLMHFQMDIKEINLPKMFDVIFHAEKIYITPKDKDKCLSDLNIMDSVTYTTTMLSYIIFPVLPVDYLKYTLKEFLTRRDNIIKQLMTIDFENIEYYKKLLDLNGKILQGDFNNVTKRRAIKNENNYFSYVLRINLSDYLPLPKHLWVEEQKIINKGEVQIYIDTELTMDLNN